SSAASDAQLELGSAFGSEEEPNMAVEKDLLEILACPNCRGEGDYDEAAEVIECRSCHYKYPVRDDIPGMLIDEAEKPQCSTPSRRWPRTTRRACSTPSSASPHSAATGSARVAARPTFPPATASPRSPCAAWAVPASRATSCARCTATGSTR